ncbi:glycosyltransferase involved in cell wall biosynthesis [Microvirga flocculans]|uniref:Glycosyltransferase involved in cell wall biosynthesis n=1 Tax=Microvirga flocculans TaxID=217168 RepID=A0A7W6IDP1_9HYPH|nr:glycosyltransferase family A protein [Microvirga flocculans]MBB4039576.1 glycosyltransferase involved in cell wall biosynthesis [Microvirga flocculans]
MTLRQSTVSIIVPNYNYGHFLMEALQSVANQDEAPIEVLIIDDCSTDKSKEVITEFLDRHPRDYANIFRAVYNQRNLGIVENFKKAVELTTGDYIAFIGADNRAHPSFIRELRSALDNNPKAGVAYFDMLIFGPRAADLAGRVKAEKLTDSDAYYWKFKEPSPEAIANVRTDNFINGSSMYRRRAYNHVGGYRKTRGPEDMDLFARMLGAGYEPVYVAKPLLEYRQHSAAQANTALLLEEAVNDLKAALQDSQSWTLKLEQDFAALKQWTTKLETDNHVLRGIIKERNAQIAALKSKQSESAKDGKSASK